MNTLEETRPDPDEILASLKLDEENGKRGRLKIFFGMCAGVGKTYTMLQSAQTEKSKCTDVVIGYIETHHRKETEDLVRGLEIIPRKSFDYKGTSLGEVDLEAVIARKPKLVLVDELAHTNAPGSRHLKRYQDAADTYDIVVEQNPLDAEALANRGVAKLYLNNNTGACEDWYMASDMGSEKAKSYLLKFCE